MLNYEKMLDTDDMDNLRKEYYRNFNPLVSPNFVLYMESYAFHLKLNTIKYWLVSLGSTQKVCHQPATDF